jgi:sterol desaturase/sphingolipid hydroxylase (fatty acid hydroxylase superfamily)
MNAIPSIINLGVGSVVVGFTTLTIFAIGLAIERTAPAEQCQPVDAIRLNVIYGLFHGFIRSAVGTMLAGISLFSIIAVGGGWITLPSEGWKVGFSAIVYLLTTDFAEYLFHRAQHAVPFLWALHSLHHSDRAVNVTTTARHHWIEFLIKAIVIYPLVGLLFAVPYQVLLVTSISGYYNFFCISISEYHLVAGGRCSTARNITACTIRIGSATETETLPHCSRYSTFCSAHSIGR